MKTALIVGGNGIIGRNLCHYLVNKDWPLIVTSQSALTYTGDFTDIRMDLLAADAVAAHRDTLREVTHVFYCAYADRPGLKELTETNSAMLENLVEGLVNYAPDFRHITFIQGGKAYGAHLGKYKTPAKESDPRHFPPDFYYNQEDYLRERSQGQQWSWTGLRPDMIIGTGDRSPMNLALIIAVYASICKALQVPMRFPGGDEAYNCLVNVTDAALLAEAMEFVALNPHTHGEIYNVTNGDIFRWSEVWPEFGTYFGINVYRPQTLPLKLYMSDKGALWKHIAARFNLSHDQLDQLVKWPFGEFIFNNPYDAFFDVNKLRRAGFQGMMLDTTSSFIKVFDELKRDHVIPAQKY